MCCNIEMHWYKPQDDDDNDVGNTLFFGYNIEDDDWSGSVKPENDRWRWKYRFAAMFPKSFTGTALNEIQAREVIEAFSNADEFSNLQAEIIDQNSC